MEPRNQAHSSEKPWMHSRRRRSASTSASARPDAKRRKTKDSQPMDLDPQFRKLDATDPVHSQRMQQRKKAVMKGKNTAGYAEYIKQIPRNKRLLRSMQTPSTPDHTLDIPNKRWQGLMRSWRVALHKYDPPDLVNAFAETSSAKEPAAPAVVSATKKSPSAPATPVKARELEAAAANGLLVDLGPVDSSVSPVRSPAISVFSANSGGNTDLDEFVESGVCPDDQGDDDSDDDFL